MSRSVVFALFGLLDIYQARKRTTKEFLKNVNNNMCVYVYSFTNKIHSDSKHRFYSVDSQLMNRSFTISLRRQKKPPKQFCTLKGRDFMEAVSSIQGPCELSQLAAVIRLDHTYSCISAKARRPKGLEERYMKNAAVLPDIQPAASVSSVDVCRAPLRQQEEPVSIHGHSIQGYQDIYCSVAEPMMKTCCGWHHPYSLELGLKIKQRLWETLSCPSLLEAKQPEGYILITESFSTTSRSFAPRIDVDISEEPLPEEP
uniref:Uncharacterized protein n=1 Tax=Sinocyclocheilus anshuiensis TaxID=1608454 RepID=A0A671K551_9TELE